jgi:hypothetical protein
MLKLLIERWYEDSSLSGRWLFDQCIKAMVLLDREGLQSTELYGAYYIAGWIGLSDSQDASQEGFGNAVMAWNMATSPCSLATRMLHFRIYALTGRNPIWDGNQAKPPLRQPLAQKNSSE